MFAVCALGDVAGPNRWSSAAVEDAATGLEVLAGAPSGLSPEAAELLEVIPAAVAALCERVERGTGGSGNRSHVDVCLRAHSDTCPGGSRLDPQGGS